jgi:hypothetical protein
MKSTAKRLSESYCRPKTKEEWEAISIYFLDEIEYYGGVSEWKQDFERCGYVFFFYSDNYGGILYSSSGNDRTEIPVSNFIDLMNDSIVSWRLEEDGFDFYVAHYVINELGILVYPNDVFPVYTTCMDEPWKGIKTYTDLLTLIRLRG